MSLLYDDLRELKLKTPPHTSNTIPHARLTFVPNSSDRMLAGARYAAMMSKEPMTRKRRPMISLRSMCCYQNSMLSNPTASKINAPSAAGF